jgi:hypothetical protein
VIVSAPITGIFDFATSRVSSQICRIKVSYAARRLNRRGAEERLGNFCGKKRLPWKLCELSRFRQKKLFRDGA